MTAGMIHDQAFVYRRLILNNNRLYTLPETIHYLTELDTLQLEDNPELSMPAKPPELNPKVDEFYNIDFTCKMINGPMLHFCVTKSVCLSLVI